MKRAMVAYLDLPSTAPAVKRVNVSDADFSRLQTFVTRRTNQLFNLLSNKGMDEARNFLSKDPETWETDSFYQKLQESVRRMVVNHSAECGIALIQKYNESLMKDEEQKQFVLRFVHCHRHLYPTSSKAAMLMDDDKNVCY